MGLNNIGLERGNIKYPVLYIDHVGNVHRLNPSAENTSLESVTLNKSTPSANTSLREDEIERKRLSDIIKKTYENLYESPYIGSGEKGKTENEGYSANHVPYHRLREPKKVLIVDRDITKMIRSIIQELGFTPKQINSKKYNQLFN